MDLRIPIRIRELLSPRVPRESSPHSGPGLRRRDCLRQRGLGAGLPGARGAKSRPTRLWSLEEGVHRSSSGVLSSQAAGT